MRKRNKTNPIFSFLLVFTLAGGLLFSEISVEAAESKISTGDKIIKELLFSTEDAGESKDDEFQEIIKENGKTYRLQKVSYELVDKAPLEIDQDTEKVVESNPIPEGEEYNAPETIEEEGVTYTLVSVEKEENVTAEEETQTVSGYTDYDRAVTASDVPATKQVTVKNQRTGENMTVTCNLKNIEALTDSAWEDTFIDITFISYDASIFHWNGVTVTKGTASPLAGYESELLSSVGADNSNYRVLNTYWTGEPYTDSDGVLCRNARADVQRKVNYYRVNYSAAVTLKEEKGTVYKATYKGTETVADKDRNLFTIKATATYKLQQNQYMPYVLAGIGIALLLLLITLILFLLRRKRKEEKENG